MNNNKQLLKFFSYFSSTFSFFFFHGDLGTNVLNKLFWSKLPFIQHLI